MTNDKELNTLIARTIARQCTACKFDKLPVDRQELRTGSYTSEYCQADFREMAHHVIETIKNVGLEIAPVKKPKDDPKPWPQDGDECYIVWNNGKIMKVSYVESAHITLLKQGNVKRTCEEAEALVAYRAAYTKLAGMVPMDWVCDWGNNEQEKWGAYPYKDEWISKFTYAYPYSQLPHFPTRESLVAAIKAMGDDMDALRFGGCM